MNQCDYKTFIDAWTNVQEVMPAGKQLSAGAMRLIVESLKQYPLEDLLAAMERHLKTSKFAPAPKDIIDLLEINNAHVGADEAWSIVIESMDERSTVVMTQEMREARAIAWPLWESGDEIGARMAFRDAYNRIIKTAPEPRWTVSLGFDVEGRESGIRKAVELGRLSHDEANRYLPSSREGGPIAGLLTGNIVEMPEKNTGLRNRWGELKQALLDGKAKLEEREWKEREQQRIEREQHRAEVLAAVEKELDRELCAEFASMRKALGE